MSQLTKALLLSGLVLLSACKISVGNLFSKSEPPAEETAISAPEQTESASSTPLVDKPLISVTSPAESKNKAAVKISETATASEAEPAITYYDPEPTSSDEEDRPLFKFKSNAKAGLLLPLSGKAKNTGTALQSAAVMALSKSGNKDFTLQFYDTQSSDEGAYAATKSALSDGVDIILGPVFSSETGEVVRAIGWDDVNVISFSSDPENLGENVFTIAPLLSEQVTEIVTYACSKGYKKFAIVTQNNKTGEYVFSAAKNAAEAETCGGAITATSFYEPDTTDFSQTIKEILPEAMLAKLERERLKEQGYEVLNEPLYDSQGNLIDENNITFDFDAVLLVDEGSRLRSLGAMLEYYDVTPDKVKLLGTLAFDDPKVKKESAFRQSWYATIPGTNFAKFASDYKKLTGNKATPPRIASLTYDTVNLVATLAKDENLSARNLTNPAGFNGIDGKFRFLPDGRVQRALTIMEITKNGQTKVLRKAPSTFPETLPEPISARTLENIKPEPPAPPASEETESTDESTADGSESTTETE